MSTQTEHPRPNHNADPDDASGRLATYLARTQTPLDLLALVTLWIVLVPPGAFGALHSVALTVRIGLSVVYAIDMAIRTTLATRHRHYVRTHRLNLAVVVFPPLRIVFSLRLVRSMFRRGNLGRFLMAAALLVLNGALVVYLYERHARGSNIHSLGQSVWWAAVTVTTVGYGDYYPVTTGGQIAAAGIMAIGILILAVVTAQVSSSFVDQAARRRANQPATGPGRGDVTLVGLEQRLVRIEELLIAQKERE